MWLGAGVSSWVQPALPFPEPAEIGLEMGRLPRHLWQRGRPRVGATLHMTQGAHMAEPVSLCTAQSGARAAELSHIGAGIGVRPWHRSPLDCRCFWKRGKGLFSFFFFPFLSLFPSPSSFPSFFLLLLSLFLLR